MTRRALRHPIRLVQLAILLLWGLPSLYLAFIVRPGGHPPAAFMIIFLAPPGLLLHVLVGLYGLNAARRAGAEPLLPGEEPAHTIWLVLWLIGSAVYLPRGDLLIAFSILILPWAMAGHVLILAAFGIRDELRALAPRTSPPHDAGKPPCTPP